MITIEELIKNVKLYNKSGVKLITKAYEYANLMHDGQKRNSGEPYIIHPLNVAYILSEMHADTDTICAGLLHDTIEDTKATKEEIENLFNSDIANLVDGVTKISKMNFSNKVDQEMANTRKIITSVKNDIRIIIIKLADRLHNMRTLEFKSEFKQKENALETLEIYVPFAYYIGAYRIKNELEDLSFSYLNPFEYRKTEEEIGNFLHSANSYIYQMLTCIDNLLKIEKIPHEMKTRTKNIYGVYNSLKNGVKSINEMHDLISIKIMVDEIKNCYIALGLIHSKYNPLNEKFKDYIYNPKVNLYRSIHTTVFGPHEKLVQTQIRTFEMDQIASFGIMTYWDKKSKDVRNLMQQEFRKKFEFYKSLTEIDSIFENNIDFVEHVKSDIFSDTIYVYSQNGEMVELPKGSTIIDLAFKLSDEIGIKLMGAKVNGEMVNDLGYILDNNDRVTILTNDEALSPKDDWIDKVRTSYAKNKIKQLLKK